MMASCFCLVVVVDGLLVYCGWGTKRRILECTMMETWLPSVGLVVRLANNSAALKLLLITLFVVSLAA